ncbi:alcohol dehydrogenase catalytic domain-containing protein [Xanthomonas citri]|uniref:alcohol dehydrogenase catalytic domain-containing protein n=1 Tax=Xanthomonas citri TaxID=346 RepID=UPI0040485881
MKAVALTRHLPIDDPESLLDMELPAPAAPSGYDLLVRVEAISVNPVDTKVRAPKPQPLQAPKVLGYDAAGVIEAVGPEVTAFAVGDEVYYAGDIGRPGSNAQYQLVDAALNLADTDRYWQPLGEVLAPQGHVGLIVEPRGPLSIGDPYKSKCIGIHWELMFTRARYATEDMVEQHRILNRAASLIDAGELRTTHTETLSPINAQQLREAHRRLESSSTIGKLVLAGW